MDIALTSDLREKIYSLLASAYIDELEKRPLGQAEQRLIAKKILEYVEGAKSWKELLDFLDYLSSSYPFLSKAVLTLRSDLYTEEKKMLLQKAENDLKNLTNNP